MLEKQWLTFYKNTIRNNILLIKLALKIALRVKRGSDCSDCLRHGGPRRLKSELE